MKVDIEINGQVRTLTEEELNTKTCVLLEEYERLIKEPT